jgi:hypothetical protein
MMEEGKLRLPALIRLRIHLMMCAFCTRFMKQTTRISRLNRSAPAAKVQLSEKQKEILQEKLFES